MGASAFIRLRRPPTRRSAGSSPPSGPVLRLLRRRGVLGEPEEGDAPDPLAETSLVLAGITSAAVQGRSALGPRPGARVLQIGRVPGLRWITSTGPRQAHLDGFDLHANVAVAADNREALEPLCRYVLRPPIAQERLSRTADGRVPLTLMFTPVGTTARTMGIAHTSRSAMGSRQNPAPEVTLWLDPNGSRY